MRSAQRSVFGNEMANIGQTIAKVLWNERDELFGVWINSRRRLRNQMFFVDK